MRKVMIAAALAAALAVGGCDAFGPGDMLGQFEWAELPETPVEESAEATLIGTEVPFLGQLNTPTACFEIEPDVRDNGDVIVLRILVNDSDRSTGCEERATSFRYQGLLRRVTRATELRVQHVVEGVGTTEFELPLDVTS